MTTPCSAGNAGRDFEQMQDHRLVGTEHVAGRDTEQQGITDLAGGAGNGNTDGSFHCINLARVWDGQGVQESGSRLAATSSARERSGE